ncbi:hypothetical protein OAU50_07835, partial [Planctomycetota bacterium]|nr:hypothetical protein [Planctomycetota bacterium]
MAGTDNQGLTPEDSLLDPDMGFGGEMEMVPELDSSAVHDVSIQPDLDPPLLSEDANVPLDVEPDPEITADNDFAPDLQTANDGDPAFGDDDKPSPELEAAAKEAKQKTRRLTVEKQGVTAELESIKAENTSLQKQLDDAKAALEAAPAQADLDGLKESLAEARTQRNAAEEQIKELRTNLETAKSELATANEKPVNAPIETDHEKKIDLMDAQITSMQAENTQLKEAMKEAQSAESRTEHAHDQLGQQVKTLEDKLNEEQEALKTAKAKVEESLEQNEELSRKLAVAEKELADNRDAIADVDKKAAEFSDHQAELDRVTKALAEANSQIETLTTEAKEAEKLRAVADELISLKTELDQKTGSIEVLQEKLDTESARSYRLSQRRIPALNQEIEDAQESVRELEAKLQKAELKSKTFE